MNTIKLTTLVLSLSILLMSCSKGGIKVKDTSGGSVVPSTNTLSTSTSSGESTISTSANGNTASSSTGSSGNSSSTTSSSGTTSTASTENASKAELGTLTQTVTNLLADFVLFKNQTFEKFASLNSRNGSIIVRYGNDNIPSGAPAGTAILAKGIAFGSYYAHGSKEIECIAEALKFEDRGGAVTAISDIRYPVIADTNSAYRPTDIPGGKKVSCATLYVPTTTFLMKGSPNCPVGWSSIYSGWLMAGHYTHGGAATNAICMAKGADFDAQSPTYTDSASYIYGTHTSVVPAPQGFPNSQWLPCAYCAKQ